METSIYFSLLQMVIKKYWYSLQNFRMKLNNLLRQQMKIKKVSTQKISLKIKFNSDDSLPLNKMLKLHMLTVIFRSAFEENGKYYPQIFLDECLYEV